MNITPSRLRSAPRSARPARPAYIHKFLVYGNSRADQVLRKLDYYRSQDTPATRREVLTAARQRLIDPRIITVEIVRPEGRRTADH